MAFEFDAAVFGLIVADLIASPMDLRRPPKPGGLVPLDRLELTTGGNVCNVGVAMARLGMRVAAAGLVGHDVLGSAMLQRLGDAGLDARAVRPVAGGQTSATVVAVEPGGERCFFHTAGVTRQLDAAAFRAGFDVFGAARFLQVGYFGLLPNLEHHLGPLLAEFRSRHPATKIALDTVNPPAARVLLDPILAQVDLFVPSRSEAAALFGDGDPHAMLDRIRAAMPRGIVGIKLDAEGCLLDDGTRRVFCPAYKITVVDTTGAGDSWFGGLLTALARGFDLQRAGQFANRVAADCCTALGASAGIRGYEDTVSRL